LPFCIDRVTGAAHVDIPLHVVKDKKLWFWAKKSRVPQAGRDQVSLSLFCDATRISLVTLHRVRFNDIATQNNGGIIGEGVEHCRAVVGH
jgi:hypothetical protein